MKKRLKTPTQQTLKRGGASQLCHLRCSAQYSRRWFEKDDSNCDRAPACYIRDDRLFGLRVTEISVPWGGGSWQSAASGV